MKILDIGEVSQLSGVPASALRYYEEVGLIAAVGRHGLRRQYHEDVLLRLKLIGLGKTAGFSLEEIAGMFGSDQALALSRPFLHQRADELDRQIQQLMVLRDTLRHVADCPAPSHLECPTFRRIVNLAGKQSVRRRKRAATD
ncbi:helix-turn-helix domain-containing protein [Leeia sp. TBRC 13508]|uniref:Helix-turn-helix domain-containing protein n=1 Tax=Leeia speluncae TaxID=2884804 RepID=A0ABS8D422_9NEIS|nr:helix-turn-helix domain-containing protein [Leeia speluncae]MCB6182956.1 helix-turn-helix domain-containing protein [Leeia speluncae]